MKSFDYHTKLKQIIWNIAMFS